MGCYPLGKIISKALGRCNGRENRRKRKTGHMRAYSPPPTYFHTNAMARSVTFSNNNPVYIIPPVETAQDSTTPEHQPIQAQPEPVVPGPSQTETLEPKEPARVRFVPGSCPHGPNRTEPVGAPVHPGYNYRYVPSPLPRWEEPPRRREYFSGEYNYYPTPVREGIYNIATDANRLTAIFSEENPNACTIV
ncbi:uncharacterized protein [Typha angustifolia]|uniref:uncharacterized protein n=1 Tax=Typha angustifolia TaxID=59011 RepID=UPI003C2D74E4